MRNLQNFGFMQGQILKVLHDTRSHDTQTVSAAEASLSELSKSQDYFPSLLSILSSNHIDKNDRLSALIYMRLVVERFWNSVLTDNVKGLILSSLPQLIMTWPVELQSNISHFAHKVISSTLSQGKIESPELSSIIFQILAQQNEESVRTGLILANSLCAALKGSILLDNSQLETKEWIMNFYLTLLNALATLFSQCELLPLLSIGFHCAYRLLASNPPIDFQQMSGFLAPILQKIGLIANVMPNAIYVDFASHALKFTKIFVKLFHQAITPEMVGQFLGLITGLLPLGLPSQIKCQLLELLNELMKTEKGPEILSENAYPFFTTVMLPLFALTEDSIDALASDPASFIADVHKFDYVSNTDNTFEDLRECASIVLYNLSDRSEIVEMIFSIVVEVYNQYGQSSMDLDAQNLLFSAFLMLSSISKGLDAHRLKHFFNDILPLYDSGPELGRCAAFMILSKSTAIVDTQIIVKCVEHLLDPFPLARYYAVLATANIINKSDDDPKAIKQQLSNQEVITHVFQSLFELGEHFRFPEIATCISSFIPLFNEMLLPFAAQLNAFMMQFLDLSIESFVSAKTTIDSVEFLVDIVMSSPAAQIEFGPKICSDIFNILQNIEQSDLFDLLASVPPRLIETLPYLPNFWDVANMLMMRIQKDSSISLHDPLYMISLFIFKDPNFASQPLMPQIVAFCIEQMKQHLEEFDVWIEYADLASNVLFGLNRNGATEPIHAMTQPLLSMVMNQIDKDRNYINPSSLISMVTLVNSLLITNFNEVASLLGDNLICLINYWMQNIYFPYSVITFVTNYNYFSLSNDLLLRSFVTMASDTIFDNLDLPLAGDHFEIEELDATDDFSSSSLWFDFAGSLIKIFETLQHIRNSNQDVFQQIPADFVKVIEQIPTFLTEFAKIKSNS